MAYEFLDHTADLKFRASGKDFEEALAEAARALTEAIAGDSKIEAKILKEFTVTIHKPEILVHDFLQELVYMFSADHLLFADFDLELKESMGYRLTAKVKGEKYDPKRHKLKAEVKAVTYHELKAEESNDVFLIEVICDT
ncbi:MAG: archease [Candidatus Altiarchaeales archaeon]|nr:archease [Candidatus Altiarchaeales archaeon]MBD3415662.1 archease [Candidatus Altiarchaeales archaeon]